MGKTKADLIDFISWTLSGLIRHSSVHIRAAVRLCLILHPVKRLISFLVHHGEKLASLLHSLRTPMSLCHYERN